MGAFCFAVSERNETRFYRYAYIKWRKRDNYKVFIMNDWTNRNKRILLCHKDSIYTISPSQKKWGDSDKPHNIETSDMYNTLVIVNPRVPFSVNKKVISGQKNTVGMFMLTSHAISL